MRKARVCKHFGQWRVDVVVLKSHGVSNEAYALAATHTEAMFLAQLLADPHEYLRAAQSKAWRSGIEDAQEGFYDPDPYRKDKTNDSDDA